jgi:hypothetical protein
MESAMKLILAEIDEATIQLTYTDGPPTHEAGEMLVFRIPLQGDLNKRVQWHYMQALRYIETFASQEARRLRSELEKTA